MPKSTTYEMLSGEVLEIPPMAPDLRAFVERVRAAVDDAGASAAQVTDLVYGLENPMLDKAAMPGRAVVTRAVFGEPAWHMLCDLIGRKRAALGSLDVAATEARYTLTVPEAAAQLGVHESAVRQSIAAKRLTAWKRGARWFLDPEEVGRYRPGPQGPTAPLEVHIGSKPGASMRIKRQGGTFEDGSRVGNAVSATVAGWERVAIISSTKESARFWLLEPGDTADEIAFEGFYVRGRFRVVERENNERRAREAFKAFRGDGA